LSREKLPWRLLRAFLRLPEWVRPAVAGGALVLLVLLPRVLLGLPALLVGRESVGALVRTLFAGAAAGIAGGLVHGLSRPQLRRLGRRGDYLSGVVILYGYLGALLLASPFLFERSSIPSDLQGALLFLVLATGLGLVAGHVWFGGPNDLDRLAEERARPQVTQLVSDGHGHTATLVSGWIPRTGLPGLLESVASALEERVPASEVERIGAALAELPGEDDKGLEWQFLFSRPLLAHFLPEGDLLAVDVLLEGSHEERTAAVHDAFARTTVDPLAA